jgi:uncharacterized membrane protein
MREKDARFWGLIRFFCVSGLLIILLISLTSTYYLIKGALILIIVFFLPGYSVVNIVFNKKPQVPEILVLSVATSISVFILIAMGVNFSGARISFPNILYPVITLSLILCVLDLLKNVLLTKRAQQVRI